MRALLFLLPALATSPAVAETLAVVHADAWTMTASEPVHDATIVIENGRIVSIAAGGSTPPGANVIDARGKPVTPGLMNAATQVGLVEVSSSADTRDMASADDRNPGFDPSRALNGNSTLVDLIRADGVTEALIYPNPSRQAVFSGEPALAHYREGPDILGIRQVAVLAVIGGGAWDKVGSRAQQWTILRKALSDAGKTTPAAGPQAGGEALRRVIAGEIPLAIQTNRETDIREAAKLTDEFHIRVVILEGAEAWRAVSVLAAAKIPVVLDPQANLPDSFDELGARQDNAAILARAGVRVAFGLSGGKIHTNYNAGLALREGAGLAVANGLPYAEALRAVTVNAHAIWDPSGGGTLSAGTQADLVIWDGDPLEPSSNAVAVIIEGRTVSIRSRQDLLAERYKNLP